MQKSVPISSTKIRILLVDDHMVLRMGVMTAASDEPDMEVIADVDNGLQAIEAFRKHRPDLVVLDLRMPGLSGIETITRLREEFGDVRIIVFSNFARGEEVYQALKAGASGFVVKEMAVDRLLDAIRRVYRGEQYVPTEVASRMGERLLAQLSPRELDVLRLVANGFSNKEIGAKLNVVEGTIKIHMTNILSKLRVADRTQAIIVAIQRGIIDIP
jgi:DNA-binding NarL/FixJ family response regulator